MIPLDQQRRIEKDFLRNEIFFFTFQFGNFWKKKNKSDRIT